MRDPKRLDKLYQHLCLVHKNHFPDLRFGQFILILERWYGKDIFYTEDSVFCNTLTQFVKEFNRKIQNNAN